MKLLFDLRSTQPGPGIKRHGGGRYAEAILFRMAEMGIKFSCYFDSSNWLSPDVKKVIDGNNIDLIDIRGKTVQEIVDEGHFDRVYSSLPRGELLTLQNCEVYGTVHDLRRLETPIDKIFIYYRKVSVLPILKYYAKKLVPRLHNAYSRRKYYKEIVNAKTKIVVVSNHTKYALKAFFPEMKDREINVFYSPCTSKGEFDRLTTKETYFMCVSGGRDTKNVLRAIMAFDRLLSRGLIKDVRMKVTGAKDASIYRYKIKNPEAFDFLGYVSDQELEQLYAGAYLFVYPTLNEGFGYPPLEAMKYGTPVISSPLSAVAEILDSAAMYFNPFLVEEIMNRMMMMMEPDVHEEFSKRAKERYLKVHGRQVRDLDGLIKYITS